MAKQSGLGDNAFIGIYDLSGDVSALGTIRGGPMALDETPINVSAMVRIGGLRDGEISFTSFFNDGSAANRSAAAGSTFVGLSALPTTDVIVTYCRGTTLGNPAASVVAKQINHDMTRGADGALSFACQALANGYGLTWGKQLTTGKDNYTGAANSTGVDFAGGGSLAFGLVAFLHVTAFTGTDATVTLQESSNNGGGDAFAAVTGGAFTQITAPTSQRIVTSLTQTVERYLRFAVSTTGGFSNMDLVVNVCRHEVAVAY